ncbi:MAG: NAD(+) synthase [Cytophagales bacterium]|nr:NAD(+) synthase [Cytophagales bacterium]
MTYTVGAACLNQTPIDWENNKNNIIYAIEYARLNGVQYLCLPELCISGYGCEDLFLSPWVYDKALETLFELKEYCYDIAVAIGVPIKYNDQNYNCACLIADTNILGLYAKQFLANDGIHYEARWFKPWPKETVVNIRLKAKEHDIEVPMGDVLFTINNLKIGFEICEDSWQKNERPGYSLAQKNVDIIFNPSASHFAFGKTNTRLQQLAIFGSQEFHCTYVFANLLGNEAGRAVYDGELLIAHHGKLLTRNKLCSFSAFNLSYAHIDTYKIENCKGKTDIAEIWDKNQEFAAAATLGLFDYMRKSKSKGYVLSLSGGADSSCCAVLVAEMVKRAIAELGLPYFLQRAGLEYLHDLEGEIIIQHLLYCAYQSTQNSSASTFEAAKSLANSLHATFYQWNIDEIVKMNIDTVASQTGHQFTWHKDDLALQNIQARCRSPLIWLLANLKQCLLISTANRSEGDVGYSTMDGDTSGSLSPIAGVDKDFVKQWLVWAQSELGYHALSLVNNLIPTAELRPREYMQQDEKDLMPYTILAYIERLAIGHKMSPKQVFPLIVNAFPHIDTKILTQNINKFFKMWSTSQWKRERLAPSFHYDDFNIDPRTGYRFPILNGGFEELR